MKGFVVVAATVTLLAPATARAEGSASQVTANASSHCTTLRAQIGATAFGQAFVSFGTCVSKLTPLERQNATVATKTCHGRFVRLYGSYSKCVTAVARSSSVAEQSLNPAQTCRAQQASMGTAAFNASYGNFGTCVSATARAQVTAQVSAASTCRAEQSDASFASSHRGKTFAQYYGTNAGDSNAFGACVAQKAQSSATVQQQTHPQQTEPANPPAPSPVDRCGGSGGPGKPRPMSPCPVIPTA